MRVIAGSLKGRILKAPKGGKTRPTADRVKEALFSILGPIDALNVLDLYAGTGALGIEALSRGARQAVFVEAAHGAIQCIRQNLSAMTLENRSAVVLQMRVERAVRHIANWAPYDLVFCDPPWPNIDEVWKFLANMDAGELFAPAYRLVLEHPANRTLGSNRFGQMKVTCARAWGDSAVTVLESDVSVTET